MINLVYLKPNWLSHLPKMVVYQRKFRQVTTYWLHDHRSAPKNKWKQVSKQIIAIRQNACGDVCLFSHQWLIRLCLDRKYSQCCLNKFKSKRSLCLQLRTIIIIIQMIGLLLPQHFLYLFISESGFIPHPTQILFHTHPNDRIICWPSWRLHRHCW